jgi:2-dehydro-3-deoxyphosphogluconate aldolase / (4S)-4-hydroxy-2-oxoglutarate aldolase
MDPVIEHIGKFGVVPVVTISQVEETDNLCRALLDGGLGVIEVTFRTDVAKDVIHRISKRHPSMLVGAGTVINIEQAKQAVKAGARFIVTPGFSVPVVDWCISQGIPVTPGIETPSEIIEALTWGLNVVKFFPAEAAGGVQMLRAISAPFRNVMFIPTGGINPKNLTDFLQMPEVLACGGSWLTNRALIENRKFGEITRLSREALDLVRSVREE